MQGGIRQKLRGDCKGCVEGDEKCESGERMADRLRAGRSGHELAGVIACALVIY
jgi:hypothetical protein